MDAALFGTGLKLAMMVIGAVSLYVGYRLFCDSPQVSEARVRAVVTRNFVAGALLAVFGLGILYNEARALAVQSHHPARRVWNRTKPTEQGSFETPRVHRETVAQRSI